MNWLKRLVAGKELFQLEAWHVEWQEHRQWFAEFEVVRVVLDRMDNHVRGRRGTTAIDVVRNSFRQTSKSTSAAGDGLVAIIGVEQRLAEMLIGIIADIQNELGFSEADKECSNGSLEIVEAIRQLKRDARQPGVDGAVAALPIATAPRDGTMVRLLVQFTEHATDDVEGPAWTIGANSFDNTGEDLWQFAGWSWEQDCWTQGDGTPIGWLPMLTAPPAPQGDARDAERYRWLRDHYDDVYALDEQGDLAVQIKAAGLIGESAQLLDAAIDAAIAAQAGQQGSASA